MLWLEPLVEVATEQGRLGFGAVRAGEVAGLFDAGFPALGHPRAVGLVEDLVWLRQQTRLTFARVGVTDPLSLGAYRAFGGLAGLEAALGLAPAEIVSLVAASGLRGRGGAGFPAGIKWRTVLGAGGGQKYIVCNADEGDSGTFADRMLIEGDPFLLIEGMAIAGLAVGATKGFVYLRSEYPDAARVFGRALEAARDGGGVGGFGAGARAGV